ncbi:MAG: phosphoadenylyl-sulfate reductase [Balneolaceae bacterium]|nr:phosphoadenylyl-sulfate reductase [Balneolaceae bacterium]
MEQVLSPILLEGEFSKDRIDQLNDRFETSDPGTILRWVDNTFGTDAALGTGFGSSGVFLIDQIQKYQLNIPIFYLDTQLLFDTTYELRDTIEQKYGISIYRVSAGMSFREQAIRYGEELWKTNPNHCCYLRKVRPLRNYLSDKKAWITGIRRSQSKERKQARIIEWNEEHEVIKVNPVADWTGEKIWDHIHHLDLPYNPMHDEGYPSIGCIPCTQPTGDAKESDSRTGRWNGKGKTECGIHLPIQDFETNKEH